MFFYRTAMPAACNIQSHRDLRSVKTQNAIQNGIPSGCAKTSLEIISLKSKQTFNKKRNIRYMTVFLYKISKCAKLVYILKARHQGRGMRAISKSRSIETSKSKLKFNFEQLLNKINPSIILIITFLYITQTCVIQCCATQVCVMLNLLLIFAS